LPLYSTHKLIGLEKHEDFFTAAVPDLLKRPVTYQNFQASNRDGDEGIYSLGSKGRNETTG
jgi:hypothetical protein